jgi:hypothetical protein
VLSDKERGAAAALTAQYRAEMARIAAADLVSPKAKRILAGRARRALREDLATLKEGSKQRADQVIRDNRYRLAGLKGLSGSDVIAFRDAQDRAAACKTPQQARALWAQAERGGDTQLAAAVAMDAWDRAAGGDLDGFGDIVSGWLSQHPEHRDAAEALAAELDGGKARQLSDRLYLEMPILPDEYRAGNVEAEAAAFDAEHPDMP